MRPALTLSTLDPSAPLDDLESLARLIPDDVWILAIGESVHAAHEFYRLRHRLMRFLVERMNFTALAWESGFPEGFLINDYVHGRRSDRMRVLIDGMTMHMGRCQEMADIVDWLRERNESDAPPVDFYGLDLPGSSAALRPVFDILAPYIEKVDPGFNPRLKRLRELVAAFAADPAEDPTKLTLVGTAVVHQYSALPATDRNELTALLADLSARSSALQRSYIERSDPETYDRMRQLLRVAAQLDLQLRAVAIFMAGDPAACEANIRDTTMVDTAEWILGRHERLIVLAHNGHIQRTPISTVPGFAPVDTLGVHLAGRFGDRYLPIGTTCGGGELIVPRTTVVDGKHETDLVIRDLPPADADVVDSVLDSSVSGTALVDLRTLDAKDAARIDTAHRMRVLDQFIDIDVRRAFDMLIHVPRITIWHSDTNASFPDLRTSGSCAG
jgi:erythromycin esterase